MKFSTGSSSSSLASDSLSRKSTLCIYTEVDATMPPPPCERSSFVIVRRSESSSDSPRRRAKAVNCLDYHT
ncbi:unnamed protein product, partial [Iphiclides podalirius]